MGTRDSRQHRGVDRDGAARWPEGRRRLSHLEAFVQTAPGLEAALVAELDEFGWAGEPEPGGVTLRTDLDGVARLNLQLASASRVLVTVGTFRATALGELERKAGGLPWDRFVAPGTGAHFVVTSRKSRLYHTGAIAERLARAAGVEDAAATATDASEEDSVEGIPGPRFVVRVVRDRVTVRADASGDHLHRRGYRRATAKAPMRETLAAGILRAIEWRPERPLVDPLCGAGTFVIEAGLRACRRAPGENRRFALEGWPGADADRLRRLRAEALARVRPPPQPLRGSDRDEGAIRSAVANSERAGVAGAVRFERRALSDVSPPEAAGAGVLIANPPWGRRIGQVRKLRDLYARIGQLGRARFAGWDLALVCPSRELVHHADPRAVRVAEIPSGGVRVGIWRVGAL